jgi:hypothetical protein
VSAALSETLGHKVFEFPERFRPSRNANDYLVERALRGFEWALKSTL